MASEEPGSAAAATAAHAAITKQRELQQPTTLHEAAQPTTLREVAANNVERGSSQQRCVRQQPTTSREAAAYNVA
eukprot:364372-Chlamydomonas_euryale.AAC.10